MPKISIIVPVYNVEKDITRCLDSIAAQTFTDWECILVNDCSLDNSEAICKKFVAQDSRFLYIKHDVNGGLAVARNTGLDNARGEYIGFVDSDDWIEPQMYEILYKNALEYNAEISACSATYVKLSGKNTLYARVRTESYLFTRDFMDSLDEFPRVRMWASLFKHDFLIQNNLRLDPEQRSAQDTLFMFQCLLKVSKLYYHDEPFYNYMENCASITYEKRFFSMSSVCALIANKKILKLDTSKKRRNLCLCGLTTRYMSILLSNAPPRITPAVIELLEKYYPKSRVKMIHGEHPKWVKFTYISMLRDCWMLFFHKGSIAVKLKFLVCIIIPLPLVRKVHVWTKARRKESLN